jgi:RNA polymerase sigma-70 factor (ECF subfamily)
MTRRAPRDGDAGANSSANPEPSDRSLLRRFQGGKHEAATQLYLRYANHLHALVQARCGTDLAIRVDPEDIVQSVFRTFFRRAAQGHYDVPEGEELWNLFLVIALNKIRATGAHHRAAKRDVRHTKTGAALDQALQTRTTPDEAVLNVLRLTIDEILETLPASQRVIVQLRIEGYSVDEIAHKSERSKRTVERALQEFRQKLSGLIQES